MVNGWKAKKLGEVAEVCMCKRIFAHQTSKIGNIPFYKIGTFGKEADAYISSQLYEEYKAKYSYPEKKDVLISAAGTLGRTVVFDGRPAYFQDSNIVWLKIDKSQLCNDYLAHYYKVIKWASSEGSTISRLYNGIICDTEILLPPLEEQAAIAEVLSDVDSLISSLQKLIEKKKAIKQGAMQELLTGKKRLPGFSGEWSYKSLGILGDLSREAINPQSLSETSFYEYSMPAYDNGRQPEKTSGKSMHSSRLKIYGEIILFNKLNVRQRRVWHVKECLENAVCSSEFLPYHSLGVHSEFLYQVLLCDKTTVDFENMSTGTSNSQKRITPSDFLEYEIALPEKDEQEAIAQVLSDMDSEIEQLEKKLAKYQQIKQGMMQELLTGRIRLKEGENNA